MAEYNNRGRTLVGVITSDKMDKTVVVTVSRKVKHKTYRKYVMRTAKYKAHDGANAYRTGDKVQIVEARPLSKDKRWRVQRLIERPDLA